jgi:hypothetical protein
MRQVMKITLEVSECYLETLAHGFSVKRMLKESVRLLSEAEFPNSDENADSVWYNIREVEEHMDVLDQLFRSAHTQVVHNKV